MWVGIGCTVHNSQVFIPKADQQATRRVLARRSFDESGSEILADFIDETIIKMKSEHRDALLKQLTSVTDHLHQVVRVHGRWHLERAGDRSVKGVDAGRRLWAAVAQLGGLPAAGEPSGGQGSRRAEPDEDQDPDQVASLG